MSRFETDRNGPVAVHVARAAPDLAYLTAAASSEGRGAAWATSELYRRIGAFLARERMQVVHERVFGSLAVRDTVIEARRQELDECGLRENGPVTYVQGRPVWGEGLAGVQLLAVRPQEVRDVRAIREGEAALGRQWERDGATFTVLQNVHGLRGPAGAVAGREAQADGMLEEAKRMLAACGIGYEQVARTWIYLSDILAWYDGFNAARNAAYARFGLMADPSGGGAAKVRLPASTGIEGDNPFAAACVMDVFAAAAQRAGAVDVKPMAGVKQADAFNYGSAFSRGVCIRQADVKQIQISGTAAIDAEGRSLFPGDAGAQVRWTLDTVEALVAQEGATLRDVCQATVFLKRAADYGAYRQAVVERGLADMPAVCVRADVCREELLFEMDGVAMVGSRAGKGV